MKGGAVAICAPSGVGKTTVARRLVEASNLFVFSVSATTRPARYSEHQGIDYFFVSRAEFELTIEEDSLLEWAEVHGYLYGTPRANLEAAQRDGKQLILDIDVQGARQLVEAVPDSIAIFLLQPSFDVLLGRLKGRKSEDEERVRRRLQTATSELEAVGEFKHVVVNARLDDTIEEIRAIIRGEGRRSELDRLEVEELSRGLLDALGEAKA